MKCQVQGDSFQRDGILQAISVGTGEYSIGTGEDKSHENDQGLFGLVDSKD